MRRVSEAADRATRRDHAVVRQARVQGMTKDAADGPRRAGSSGQPRHIAVGGDLTFGDPGHDAQHAPSEHRRAGQRITASERTRPSARGRLMWLRYASVGAISTGAEDVRYLPALMPQPIRITGTRWSYA